MNELTSTAYAAMVQEVAVECYRTAAEHGFHKTPNPLPQSLMLIVSEAAEALEAYRDDIIDAYEHKEASPAQECTCVPKPIGVMSELADVIIRALDTAEEVEPGRIGIVLLQKMAYNETRPVGHGRTRL